MLPAAPIMADGGGIESLIYLVFALFWLVANIFSARSKKNKRPPTSTPREEPDEYPEESESAPANPFEEFARQLERAAEATREEMTPRPTPPAPRPTPEIEWDPLPIASEEDLEEPLAAAPIISLSEQEVDVYRVETGFDEIKAIREMKEMRLDSEVEAARSIKQSIQLVDFSSVQVPIMRVPIEGGSLYTGVPIKVKNLRKRRNLRTAVLDQIILSTPKAISDGREELPGFRP